MSDRLDFMDDDCDSEGFPIDFLFDCCKCAELGRSRHGEYCEYKGCICFSPLD